MRYFIEKPANTKQNTLYFKKVDHPLYNSCRLYKMNDTDGLAIVQLRFNSKMKVFWYDAPDSWIMDKIVKQPGFADYVFDNAADDSDGIFPTVTVRQVMYALKMKPLKKEWWESQELKPDIIERS